MTRTRHCISGIPGPTRRECLARIRNHLLRPSCCYHAVAFVVAADAVVVVAAAAVGEGADTLVVVAAAVGVEYDVVAVAGAAVVADALASCFLPLVLPEVGLEH